MTADKLHIYAVTVFMLSVVMVYTHPIQHSTCEGKQLADSFLFNLPTNLLRSHCELQLKIKGAIRAIYEHGKAPVDVQPPVLSATLSHFILATCPASVALDLECPEIPDPVIIYCSCLNSTAHPTNSTSLLTGLNSTAHPTNSTSLLTDHDTPKDNSPSPGRHHAIYITVAVIGIVAIGGLIIALGLVIYKRRKSKDSPRAQNDSPGSSTKGSNDHLLEVQTFIQNDPEKQDDSSS
ncbi:uncharacterized protein LOC134082131 isoform X1 [Sardina pilchardus]|uniref:uncharacterized protein LOC134082131 isoform X1 n=1 Tax=Sardina pilchardus TaxID=27697 RepID=UPI002E12EC9F